LLKEGVRPGAGNLPMWNPSDPGFERVSSLKARRAGWVTRPLKQTAVDAWKSYCSRVDPNIKYPQHQWRYDWGISTERQTEILRDWEAASVTSHRPSVGQL
jgi:hypothetical protein